MQSNALPTAAGCSLHDAGEVWDAVRVPRAMGLEAMRILGQRCGAVVEDPSSLVLYFFVRVGAAAAWDVENTRVLGTGTAITIPPARRMAGPGVHWRMCPGDDGWITDASALRAAIGDAFGAPVTEQAAQATA